MTTKETMQPKWLADFKSFLVKNNIVSTLPESVESYLTDLISGLTRASSLLKDQNERLRIEKKLWATQLTELTESLAIEKQKGIIKKGDLVLVKFPTGATIDGVCTEINSDFIRVNEDYIDRWHIEIFKLITPQSGV